MVGTVEPGVVPGQPGGSEPKRKESGDPREGDGVVGWGEVDPPNA